ncbi:hypothetical protein [Zoogloea sp.]|uniref:hypothetical protein n=1 Tax=Zoogloea sp. TaxID=49181 RepID=UPI0035B15A0A
MTSNNNNPFSQDAVQYVLGLPVLSLKKAQSLLSPPGDWVFIDDVIRLLQSAKSALFGLRPRGMANTNVVISRDMTQAALVRTKGPQRDLHDDAGDQPPESSGVDKAELESDGILDNSKPFDSEGAKAASRRAIETAQKLISMYKSGAISNAEDFLEVLSTSPDAAVTRHYLTFPGKHPFDVSTPDFTFPIGGSPVFPQHLESAERFKVTLENIGDVNKDSVSARLISVNSGQKNPCIRFFSNNKRFTVHIGTSHDALLIRHPGVSLCDELKAEVTVTVDTTKGVVCALTLVRILNKDALKPFVTEISKQIEIQFDA